MRRCLLLAFLFSVSCVALAQEGASLPSSWPVYIAVDERFPPKTTPIKSADDRDPRDRTAKMHCLICETDLNPAVLVLTRSAPSEDSPAGKMAKQLDPIVKEFRGNSFAGSVIYLTLDKDFPLDIRRNEKGEFERENGLKQVRDLSAQIKTNRLVFGMAPRNSPNYASWGIGDNDETVVILYNRLKVIKKWTTITDAEIPEIVKAIKAEAGK
ncbi:MAG: hypothetical protein ACRC8S_07300 [Fimbriiglobus sp.]